ncbi:MAG: histidine kinase, partial [Gammaproteobacteria bacterium]|nr:histidine kinase [Gammaproteobacteria bacterium]
PSVIDTGAPESGAVYLFERAAQGWRQTAYIKTPDSAEYDAFGSALALNGDGDVLVAAAAGADGPSDETRDTGAVYWFSRSRSR